MGSELKSHTQTQWDFKAYTVPRMSHAPNKETHWKTSDTKIHLDIHARHRRTFRFPLWRSTWPWACCSTSRYLGLTVINAVWCIAVETRRLDRRVSTGLSMGSKRSLPPKKEDLFCSTQLVFSHLGILETTEGLQQHLYHFACCKRIVKRCYKTLFTTQLAPLCCVLIYMSLLRWESRYIHPDFSCNKTTSVSCTVMCRLTVSWTSKGF